MDTDEGPVLSGNALRFAHLSDLHLPHEPRLSPSEHFSKRQLSVWAWRRRRAVQSPVVLAALLADLQSHRLDRILVTGDITNFSLPAEFTAAAHWLGTLAAPVSVVPGNHDALVPVPHAEGWGKLERFSGAPGRWPYVHRQDRVSFIGLKSALPTAPLLASGRLGSEQCRRLAQVLARERTAGQLRILMLHHPVAEGAVSARKALRDRRELRAVLREQGASLVLHGHARIARLDALAGPSGQIPCLCVPSSTALPNPHDEAARWHLVELPESPGGWARVLVRQWSVQGRTPGDGGFIDAARYELRLGT